MSEVAGSDPSRGRRSAQDTGASAGRDELAVQSSALARALQQSRVPHTTLVEIVAGAVALIPGCDEGSISVVTGRRRIFSEGPSGELPRVVDALQEELGQGPCLDAVHDQQTVRVADMASETRWPLFAARALQAGAAGMLSFQLYVEGDTLGALNLHSRRAGAFTDESEHVGLLFASHAAIAYAGVKERSELVQSVASRQVIVQAQGILMERHKLTADQAFALLARASQDRNVKTPRHRRPARHRRRPRPTPTGRSPHG